MFDLFRTLSSFLLSLSPGICFFSISSLILAEKALSSSEITIVRRRDMPEGPRVVRQDLVYGSAMSTQWLSILKEEIVLLRVGGGAEGNSRSLARYFAIGFFYHVILFCQVYH